VHGDVSEKCFAALALLEKSRIRLIAVLETSLQNVAFKTKHFGSAITR